MRNTPTPYPAPENHIAARVLALCTEPRTSTEIEAAFRDPDDARLARYTIYNLVRRGLLCNLTQGRHSRSRPGRFVVPATQPKPRTDGGSALARAWVPAVAVALLTACAAPQPRPADLPQTLPQTLPHYPCERVEQGRTVYVACSGDEWMYQQILKGKP